MRACSRRALIAATLTIAIALCCKTALAQSTAPVVPPDPLPSLSDGPAKKSITDFVAHVKLPQVEFVDDGPGKAVGINRFIGRRRIFAFGNSDGVQQMLEWTAAGGGARFMGLVHRTDAEREYAYDRNSPVGKLDKALDEATAKGWTVVDMKNDWKTIFPFQRE
jgi:hypothetical protein